MAFLGLALTLSVLVPVLLLQLSQAGSLQPRIEVAAISLDVGATADVAITAKDIPSPGASGFTLKISFTTGDMQIIEVLPGDSPFGGFFNFTTGDGLVVMSDLQISLDPGPTGTFRLATLKVKATGASGSSTDLVLTVESFIDPQSNDITVAAVNGKVDIAGVATGPRIEVGEEELATGATADVAIIAKDIPSPGASGFTLKISFTTGDMQIIEVLPGDSPFGGFFNFTTGDGLVVMSDLQLSLDPGPTGTFRLATLKVKATGASGSSTDLVLTVESFIDPQSNDIAVAAVNGKVTIITVEVGAPTASFTFTPTAALEGGAVSFVGSGSTAGAGANSIVEYAWDFGDATAVVSGSSATVSHAYADEGTGSYTVSLTVKDDNGGTGTTSKTVPVSNVAPNITSVAASPSSPGTGETVTLIASFTDPGSTDTHTATINWGDNTGTPAGTVNQSTKTVTGTHSYPNTGSYTVTVVVTDNDGDSDTDSSRTISVISVGAENKWDATLTFTVVTAGPDQTVESGDTVSLATTFTDLGINDTHTATVNWGEGAGPVFAIVTEPSGGNPGLVSSTHVYASEDSFTVTVKVTDKDSGEGVGTLTVNVGKPKAPTISRRIR